MAHDITHRTPHTTVPHIHPTWIPYLLQPRATLSQHHATMTCSCGDVPTAKQHSHVICSWLFHPIPDITDKYQRENRSLLACTSSGNSMTAHINQTTRPQKKNASHIQTHNANIAQLISSQVGGRLNSASITRSVSKSRHVSPPSPSQQVYWTASQVVISPSSAWLPSTILLRKHWLRGTLLRMNLD